VNQLEIVILMLMPILVIMRIIMIDQQNERDEQERKHW
jgi:preprotein translocase subunit YajC